MLSRRSYRFALYGSAILAVTWLALNFWLSLPAQFVNAVIVALMLVCCWAASRLERMT